MPTAEITIVSSSATAEQYVESSYYLKATRGRSWHVEFSYQVSDAALALLVEIIWFDGELNQLSIETLLDSASGNPTTWEDVSYDVVVPFDAVYGKLRFYGKLASSVTTGTAEFDSLFLEEREARNLPIVLIGQAKRPNGNQAVIAGTATHLYRYYAFDDGQYYEPVEDEGYYTTEDDYIDDYYEYIGDTVYIDDYYDDEPGRWGVVGLGYDSDGQRWEAVNINGYSLFNNGSDLVQTYRVEEDVVKPNYELREAGVALVGTIAEFGGILMCGDIAALKQDQIEPNFAHEDGGTLELRQHGPFFSYPFTGIPVIDSGNNYVDVTSVAATANGLTSATGTATFVCVRAHQLTTGDLVNISGADDAAYNGLFTVTVID